MDNITAQFSELLSSPLGDFIAAIGRGVGEAQAALDQGSLQAVLDIYNIDDFENSEITAEQAKLLEIIRSIGYQPTFYTIPETECEAQVSLALSITNQDSKGSNLENKGKSKIYATPINAGNVNKFGLTANASAKIKFKIVAVPPPAGLDEMRIVPNLINKVYTPELQALLESIGLILTILPADVEYNTVKKYRIESQFPAPKTTVTIGSELEINIKKM